MTTTSIQQSHPEAAQHEVFFTNANSADFLSMNFASKRKGEHAFDGNGSPISKADWFPVFISSHELEESGRTLDELRKEFREKVGNK